MPLVRMALTNYRCFAKRLDCGALSVRCVNLVGFIKDQGWTF